MFDKSSGLSPVSLRSEEDGLLQLLLVGIGGCIGAIMRYSITRWLISTAVTFPFATLLVNVLGSFLLGLFATWIMHKTAIEGELRLLIQVGLFGALTTFSTFSLDTLNLLNSGQLLKAMLNVLLNVTLCLVAVWLGSLLARQLG